MAVLPGQGNACCGSKQGYTGFVAQSEVMNGIWRCARTVFLKKGRLFSVNLKHEKHKPHLAAKSILTNDKPIFETINAATTAKMADTLYDSTARNA